jgi:hypothetical protein
MGVLRHPGTPVETSASKGDLSSLEAQVVCFTNFVETGAWRPQHLSVAANVEFERLLRWSLGLHDEFARTDAALTDEVLVGFRGDNARGALRRVIGQWVSSCEDLFPTVEQFLTEGFLVNGIDGFDRAYREARWMIGDVTLDEWMIDARDAAIERPGDRDTFARMMDALPPSVQKLARRAFVLFHENPRAPGLDNCPLPDAGRGRYPAGSRSIAITLRYRAFYAPADAATGPRSPMPVWYWIGSERDCREFGSSQTG